MYTCMYMYVCIYNYTQKFIYILMYITLAFTDDIYIYIDVYNLGLYSNFAGLRQCFAHTYCLWSAAALTCSPPHVLCASRSTRLGQKQHKERDVTT